MSAHQVVFGWSTLNWWFNSFLTTGRLWSVVRLNFCWSVSLIPDLLMRFRPLYRPRQQPSVRSWADILRAPSLRLDCLWIGLTLAIKWKSGDIVLVFSALMNLWSPLRLTPITLHHLVMGSAFWCDRMKSCLRSTPWPRRPPPFLGFLPPSSAVCFPGGAGWALLSISWKRRSVFSGKLLCPSAPNSLMDSQVSCCLWDLVAWFSYPFDGVISGTVLSLAFFYSSLFTSISLLLEQT